MDSRTRKISNVFYVSNVWNMTELEWENDLSISIKEKIASSKKLIQGEAKKIK